MAQVKFIDNKKYTTILDSYKVYLLSKKHREISIDTREWSMLKLTLFSRDQWTVNSKRWKISFEKVVVFGSTV